MSYATDEYAYQGVKAPIPEALSPVKTSNCSAVKDLYLEWDFSTHVWSCVFVSGPHIGVKKQMSIRHLNKDVWEALRLEGKVEPAYSKATVPQKKDGLRELLIQWACMC